MDKYLCAPDDMRLWHETPASFEGVIKLSRNAEASHLKSPHDSNMGMDAHDMLGTLHRVDIVWLAGQYGVSTTTTTTTHNVGSAHVRIICDIS